MFISRENIKDIAIIVAILLAPLLLEKTSLYASDNRNYLQSRDTPEIQKETAASREGRVRKAKDLNLLEQEARDYRAYGFKLQQAGNLDAAMSFYQKAIEVDPAYAVAYNDLGVIYEIKGDPGRAEDSYLRAINIDSDYLSAYSNLALFYENKRDMEKAFLYWQKRAELGSASDPWTEKAKNRINDLIQVTPSLKQKVMEEEAIELTKNIAQEKENKRLEGLRQAQGHLGLAKKLDRRGEYKSALEETKATLAIDPQNKEALLLTTSIKGKISKEEKGANIKNMQLHFQNVIAYYQQDNPQAARQELEKIRELTKSLQNN